MAGTRWVRLDVQYLDNPKIAKLSNAAKVLHIAYVTHTAALLTDGFVAHDARAVLYARCALGRRAGQTARMSLVDARLLVETERDGVPGDLVHDFLDMNPQLASDVVAAERAANRERQRRHRANGHSVT